jgi:hypothetical protein
VLTISTTSPKKNDVQQYIDDVADLFSSATVFVGGYQVIGEDLKRKKNVEFMYKMEDLIQFVEEMGPDYTKEDSEKTSKVMRYS